MQVTDTQIVADLATLLSNFQGREYSGTIDAQTLFFGELGFASIDAIVLGEELEKFYGRKFPFHSFLAAAQARGAQDISVSELADFLHQQLNADSASQ